MLLAGCGSEEPRTDAEIAASASAAASSCPTDNTQAFPKARFVLNVGLAAGAFHQWIWKPYQAGTFQEGAEGRTAALVKAGLAGAFAAKQVKDATENVKADPTLCKVLAAPLTQLGGILDGLKGQLTAGDASALPKAEGLIAKVVSTSAQQGITITEQKVDSLTP